MEEEKFKPFHFISFTFLLPYHPLHLVAGTRICSERPTALLLVFFYSTYSLLQSAALAARK
jgi:hypothetical protein